MCCWTISHLYSWIFCVFLGSSEITPAQLQGLHRLLGGTRFPPSLDHWLAPFCPGVRTNVLPTIGTFWNMFWNLKACFECANILLPPPKKMKENKHQTSWTHTNNLFTIYPLAHQKPVNKPEDYWRLVICSVTFSGQKCWLWALVRILHFPRILKGNICY